VGTAKLVDERLGVLRTNPAFLGSGPTIALELAKAFELDLTSEGLSHELTLRLALSARDRLRFAHQLVRDRD